MPHEITVIKFGPPGMRMKTIQDGDVFICPNTKCGNPIHVKTIVGICGKLHPDYPLICSKCNRKYGIAL